MPIASSSVGARFGDDMGVGDDRLGADREAGACETGITSSPLISTITTRTTPRAAALTSAGSACAAAGTSSSASSGRARRQRSCRSHSMRAFSR
jgi:hypothetical protein